MRYRVQLIPLSRRQRTGTRITTKSITVHNTADVNATAANAADYFCRENLGASFHIAVDDKEAVLIIPLNEKAWHTGTTLGNNTSIGIEVCEFSDRARQNLADKNAQLLIASMLNGTAPAAFRATHLNTDRIRTHQSWLQYGTSGKYCPRMIIPWWGTFVAGIKAIVNGETVPAPRLDPIQDTTPLLRLGSTSSAVRTLQKALITHGYKLSVDGVFGSNTLNAVVSFQKAHGLVVDGIVGDNTWAALVGTPVGTAGDAEDTRPVLSFGSTGSSVRYAQDRMTRHGYFVTVDGIFSSRMKTVLIAFQKAKGLVPDGVIGPATWNKLDASPVPYIAVSLPTLRRGDKGPYVSKLQARLNVVKLNDLVVDGVFGQDTEGAVKRFQRDKGLRIDGIVGVDTWKAMGLYS